jgi:hypothetical protein
MTADLDRTRLTELQLTFLDYAGKWLATIKEANCQIKPRVEKQSYSYEIEVKPHHSGSFTVSAFAEPEEIVVFFEGWHRHFSPADENELVEEVCKSALGLMEAGISGQCKLIVKKASGKGYRWSLYFLNEGKWEFYSIVGLLFYNYFGRRSKEELINRLR